MSSYNLLGLFYCVLQVFREHKIDGTTLPHLSEEHLLNFVKMKLGPAIRLRLAIARLKPVAQ